MVICDHDCDMGMALATKSSPEKTKTLLAGQPDMDTLLITSLKSLWNYSEEVIIKIE
jgi:hypothetical protein